MDKTFKETEKKSRILFSLDSPYTTPTWPHITAEEQSVALELLCDLLAPIGQHRSTHNQPSKGKRSKKRKSKTTRHALEESKQRGLSESIPQNPLVSPAPPDLSAFLTIGFNSTTRQLEALAQKSVPSTLPSHLHTSNVPLDGQSQSLENLIAIFVPRSSQLSILYPHLPLLIATASLASASSPPICLVTLPKAADARLSAALALPRVGLIGLMEGAPHSAPLSEYVREHVSKVEVPWLNEAKAGKYLPLKVNAMQTSAPIVQKEAVNGKRLKTNGHFEHSEARRRPGSSKQTSKQQNHKYVDTL